MLAEPPEALVLLLTREGEAATLRVLVAIHLAVMLDAEPPPALLGGASRGEASSLFPPVRVLVAIHLAVMLAEEPPPELLGGAGRGEEACPRLGPPGEYLDISWACAGGHPKAPGPRSRAGTGRAQGLPQLSCRAA